jgi:hypothetical protein
VGPKPTTGHRRRRLTRKELLRRLIVGATMTPAHSRLLQGRSICTPRRTPNYNTTHESRQKGQNLYEQAGRMMSWGFLSIKAAVITLTHSIHVLRDAYKYLERERERERATYPLQERPNQTSPVVRWCRQNTCRRKRRESKLPMLAPIRQLGGHFPSLRNSQTNNLTPHKRTAFSALSKIPRPWVWR